jgi:GINS complex subunit 4
MEEQQYATSHQAILHNHYHSSFLAQFPSSLQKLDDTAGGISMVEMPDLDCAVFVRALTDGDDVVAVEGTDIEFRMRKGSIYVVRWSAIRGYVERGDAELL